MMNQEANDEGTASLEEEMYRQEIYRNHAAALKALAEKRVLTRAAEIAEEESGGDEMEEEGSAEEEQSGGGEMEDADPSSSG